MDVIKSIWHVKVLSLRVAGFYFLGDHNIQGNPNLE